MRMLRVSVYGHEYAYSMRMCRLSVIRLSLYVSVFLSVFVSVFVSAFVSV